MRLETLPLIAITDRLDSTDFVVFLARFVDIVRHQIPTSNSVQFLTCKQFCSVASHVSVKKREKIFLRVKESGVPEPVDDHSLLFPVSISGGDPLSIFVSSIDPTVINKMSEDWLRECCEHFTDQFLHIKNNRLDPVSNLYNSLLLSEILNTPDEVWKGQVVLIEVRPMTRLPKDVLNHVRAVARSLGEFNRYHFPLFYVGHAVFACLVPDKQNDFLKSFCLSLITFMKSKGFKRIHCGSSKALDTYNPENDPLPGNLVFDQAWTALHTACKRGPFAFCDYDVLAYPDHFPLKRLPRSTVSKLQRRWRNNEQHSLIYFVPDYKQPSEITDILVAYFGQHTYVMSEEGFFVIRRNSTAKQSQRWAESLSEELIKEKGKGYSLSAGISEYPFQRYTKSEIIRNCQKAVLHGEFLGYGSSVIFDAVSLNISGDIYYAEGDLAGAVREYRHGLQLDPENINLLNSLGVTYALMNRSADALITFDKVLKQDSSNFMALYNSGLGAQAGLRYEKAIKLYLKALNSIDTDDDISVDAVAELWYQLGTAYYFNDEYAKSIESLKKWFNKQRDDRGRQRCCRYIGISLFHLGQSAEAMAWLQRALAFNEEDAEALSILGELYIVEKEGNEIGLRLMEKSLELEHDNRQFMLRIARGLNECGRHEEALTILKKCVKSSKFRVAAWFELSVTYKYLKKYTKVRYYLRKLLENESAPEHIKVAARIINSEITAR